MTYYNGSFDIQPPLTPQEVEEDDRQFSEERQKAAFVLERVKAALSLATRLGMKFTTDQLEAIIAEAEAAQ